MKICIFLEDILIYRSNTNTMNDDFHVSRRMSQLLIEGDFSKKSGGPFDSLDSIDKFTHTYPIDIDDDSCEFNPPPTP